MSIKSNAVPNVTLKQLLEEILAALGGGGGPPPPPTTTGLPSPITIPIIGASKPTPVVGGPIPATPKAIMLQNVSTNPVTLGGAGVAVGSGFILNAPLTSGNAGDTVTITAQSPDTFVDLTQLYFNQTGTGATLSAMVFT